MLRSRHLLLKVALTMVLQGLQASAAPTPEPPAPAKDAGNQPKAPEAPANAGPSPIPVQPKTEAIPQPPPAANAPRYSLEAYHQDAMAVIMEYARQANQSVTMLDTFVTRISVRFKNLPFEKGLRKIMLASDLDFVKDEDGYTVGLPCDLKVRVPSPEDRVVDGTYRCRRISADTLVKTIVNIMGNVEMKAATGPQFLTPAVESASTGSGDLSIKALAPTDPNYHTHDVVFSGPPALVARALSLARKFDQPRKQVRVNVRIVEITANFERNLGVDWMSSLNLTATETANANVPPGAPPMADGIKVGRFNHLPLTLTATLNAAETKGDAKTLANPTLMVLDGEKSFILSGTKYVYPQVQTLSAAGAPVYTIATEKVGVYLQVGVQVGLDDDMVLSIFPQVSAIQRFENINGGNYPVISTNEEQATVRAIKGDVIVLGGLKLDQRTYNSTALPFLGQIPMLGKLFSSTDKFSNTDDLMIFLTPELVEDVPPPLDLKLETFAPEEQAAP